ncbi:MAG TPA: cadherin-like domain-containing protein, partial [Methylomirabilota bacterium]|nr:cadherin-like domain-containing protein [Methylomirabilota bacterium]
MLNAAKSLRVSAAIALFLLGLTSWAWAGIDVGPLKQVEPPDNFANPNNPLVFPAEEPKIGFDPAVNKYAVVYHDDLLTRSWRGSFLDEDGNLTSGPFAVFAEGGNVFANLVDVLPFPSPFGPAMNLTFQAFGLDTFGANVFVGDVAGVALTPGFAESINNYTNSGGDKFNATNCGEHETAGPSAVDAPNSRFFLAYQQSVHFFEVVNGIGFCRTSRSDLMVGYHQNARPFQFANGPYFVETNAGAADAGYNPIDGHIWFAYVSPGNQLKIQRYTPAGATGPVILVGPSDGKARFGFSLAVNPFNGNVLATWTEQVPKPTGGTTPAIFAQLLSSAGGLVGNPVQLTDAATHNIQQQQMAATRDHFLIVATNFIVGVGRQAIGLALDPAGHVAGDWVPVDNGLQFLDAQYGLVANPHRGTYGLVLSASNNVYFSELTPILNRAPTAGPDSATTDEDTPVDIDVLSNDSDPEGDAFDIVSVAAAGNGTTTLNADNTVHYVPNPNFNGTDTFLYTLRDSNGNESQGTVTVTVRAVNDPPVPVADSYETDEDTPLNVGVGLGVLANDTDPDGDPLTAVLVSGPQHAQSFTLNADGSFNYVPAANFHGTDGFSYKPN